MKFKSLISALFALALTATQVLAQATLLPPGEQCFQATTGTSGMVGLLGSITGGSSYTTGTYGGVSLSGGSGSGATANISVSGGAVTSVTVLNPGINYVVGDVLSAIAASIGGSGSGFSVGVASVAINSAVAGGSVGYYIPNTLSFKQTWQDAGQTILNTNPVGLDSNGCAVVYGAGIYRQILKDSLGNTVWDKLTASTGGSSPYWAAQAGGTPNAITVTDASFTAADGQTIQFLALAANTGPATLQVSGGATYSIVKDTSTGPTALSGGEIGPANTPMVTFDAVNQEFHLVNPASTSGGGTSSAGLTPPQGYLNLVGQSSGDVVQTSDVIGAATIFYSPFVGNTLPIWNGTSFVSTAFSELTAALTSAASPSNTIQDACVFSNNGVPTLVIGPSWTTVTAGSGSRGTGAGTAQLSRVQGIWVNANAIIGYNGLSSYSIAANQCTYVGSISVDATAGQVSAYRAVGQSRKFGIWNAYNRVRIQLIEADPTTTWTSSSTFTWRQANSSANNYIAVFSGLPEEEVIANITQNVSGTVNGTATISVQNAIGVNSTTANSGKAGLVLFTDNGVAGTFGIGGNMDGGTTLAPFIGIQQLNALEQINNNGVSIIFQGTSASMRFTAEWKG